MKTIISGANFLKFVENQIVFGRVGKVVKREKDGANVATNPNEKAGSIMGYELIDKFGNVQIIGASATIKDTFEKLGENAIVKITFLGKGENAKKQPVNRFKIEQLDDADEWAQLDPLPEDHESELTDAEESSEPETEPETKPVKKGKK